MSELTKVRMQILDAETDAVLEEVDVLSSASSILFPDGKNLEEKIGQIEKMEGPQGPKGDTGATGPQGPKGDTGATGPIIIRKRLYTHYFNKIRAYHFTGQAPPK